MHKAFLFDMDGVLIDSERAWHGNPLNEKFIIDLFSPEIYEVVKKDFMGGDSETWYNVAVEQGFTMNKQEYYRALDTYMETFYPVASITEGIDSLIDYLISHDFRLGLVSSSRMNWINLVLPRLAFREKLEYVISVNDRLDLKGKPEPDGYLDAMNYLKANPSSTIILEDSNRGIKAAKASGAYTIGYKGNILDGYEQGGADVYAHTMNDVIDLVKEWEKKHD